MKHKYILILSLVSSHVLACTVPYKESTWSKEELIRNTRTIVLAEVGSKIEKQDAKTKWVFKTIESIKGYNSSNFDLTLSNAPESYVEVDFESHTSKEFWEGTYGRLPWVPGWCSPYYSFVVGGKYLLFLDSLKNGASAERITSESNRWLVFVKSKVSKKN